jgi:uncharacterized protein (DUF433 family)
MAEALNLESFPLQADSEGVIRVRGTRVMLDTIWAAFQEGATAEEIVQQYPSLSLADACQAIGYSLRNPAVLTRTSQSEAKLPRRFGVRTNPGGGRKEFVPDCRNGDADGRVALAGRLEFQ